MNILVLYYSQTGQLEHILKSMFKELEAEINIDYIKIEADPNYPFPWSSDAFFDTFPESKEGISCKLIPIEFNNFFDFSCNIF